ncbi:uncharacterized protein VTP21DRAFT_7954 [Calcarisporiella thermophila]|uniref:uncharacterized protein n=1 Tax=Calcarisporiella thermophila TaxID=911321 RepID=UPI0037436A74
MSEENTPLDIEYIRNHCENILRDSEEVARVYYECMITDKYGQRYLDPAKCETNNFDPIKACNDQVTRMKLIAKYCSDISRMYDWREADRLILSLIPEKYQKKQTGRSSKAPYIPKQSHMRVEKRSQNKIISSVSSAAQRIIPKKVQKRSGKQSKREALSMLCKAGQLVGCEVNIGDTYAKVIAAKMTEDSVLVEVKEEVEEGVWDQYEIEYNINMKPLH